MPLVKVFGDRKRIPTDRLAIFRLGTLALGEIFWNASKFAGQRPGMGSAASSKGMPSLHQRPWPERPGRIVLVGDEKLVHRRPLLKVIQLELPFVRLGLKEAAQIKLTKGQNPMKIDGACHCGFITFEAEVDPEKVASAIAPIARRSPARPIAPRSRPRPTSSASSPASRRSTSKRRRAGTSACRRFARDAARRSMRPRSTIRPRILNIRVGIIRQRDQLVPKRQVWGRSRQSWVDHLDEIKRDRKAGLRGASAGLIHRGRRRPQGERMRTSGCPSCPRPLTRNGRTLF